MIYFWRFQLDKYEKSGFGKQSFCIKIWKSPNLPTRNTVSPFCPWQLTMCSACLSNPSSSVYVLKKALFCCGGFESVSCLFLSRPVHTMRLVSQNTFVLLSWNQRSDLWISEVERSCVRTKQNSFTLYSITTRTDFANVGSIFYKVHSLSSEQFFDWIELRKLVQSSIYWFC